MRTLLLIPDESPITWEKGTITLNMNNHNSEPMVSFRGNPSISIILILKLKDKKFTLLTVY